MALGGCAQVGPVYAPSAGLPRPVGDLTARRDGPEILLHWTPPTRTSDGAAYSADRYGAVRYEICLWPGVENGAAVSPPHPPPAGTSAPAPAQIPSRRTPLPGAGGRYPVPGGALMPPCPKIVPVKGGVVSLAALAPAAPLATLALAATNGAGRWAGWSNPVTVPLAPVAPPPQPQGVQLTPRGVRLRWRVPQPPPQFILIFRQQGRAPAQRVGEVAGDRSSYLDTSAVRNQTYTYWLRSAAGTGLAMAESAESAPLHVFNADLFPPAAPTGLEAVRAPAGAGVDLSWNAVAAGDLAGYNVYRRLPGEGQWEKRNATLLLTPVFHDTLGAAAEGVAYAVTAVDTAGNESLRSLAVVVH